jgi:hypothetical protein
VVGRAGRSLVSLRLSVAHACGWGGMIAADGTIELRCAEKNIKRFG